MISLRRLDGQEFLVAPNQIAAIEGKPSSSRTGARIQLATDGQWYDVMEFPGVIQQKMQAEKSAG